MILRPRDDGASQFLFVATETPLIRFCKMLFCFFFPPPSLGPQASIRIELVSPASKLMVEGCGLVASQHMHGI